MHGATVKIKIGLKELRLKSSECIHLAHIKDNWRQHVNAVMNLQIQ